MEQSSLYFIHITDTHLNAPGHETFLKLDTSANLREIFAHIRTLSMKPAFVVITGDLIHEGNADDYRFLRQMLDAESEALGAPILVALGNHDRRAPFQEGYNGQQNEDAYYFVQSFDGLRVFVLDSHYPGHEEGLLSAEQSAWLRAELAADTTPALLCIHHPPHPNSFFANTDHLLTNSGALADAIAGQNVIGILSGHIHFNSVAAFHGALSAAGQGTAFGLDATERTGMRLINAYGYNLGIVRGDTLSLQPFSMQTDRRELLFITFEQIMRMREQQPTPASD